jgi:hypothetical protein
VVVVVVIDFSLRQNVKTQFLIKRLQDFFAWG